MWESIPRLFEPPKTLPDLELTSPTSHAAEDPNIERRFFEETPMQFTTWIVHVYRRLVLFT
jgi:hypothetical protein